MAEILLLLLKLRRGLTLMFTARLRLRLSGWNLNQCDRGATVMLLSRSRLLGWFLMHVLLRRVPNPRV